MALATLRLRSGESRSELLKDGGGGWVGVSGTARDGQPTASSAEQRKASANAVVPMLTLR